MQDRALVAGGGGGIAFQISLRFRDFIGNPGGQALGGHALVVLQGERGLAVCERHVAILAVYVRVAQLDGEIPVLRLVPIRAAHRLAHGQAAGLRDVVCKGHRRWHVRYDGPFGIPFDRCFIAVLTGFLFLNLILDIDGDILNGDALPVLQLEGGFTVAVQRKRALQRRLHGLIRASSLIVKRSSRQRRTVLLCQRHGEFPFFLFVAVAGHCLGHRQPVGADLCVGEGRRVGPVLRNRALVAGGGGGIACLISLRFRDFIGSPGGDVLNGDALPVLQLEGGFTVAVQRKRALQRRLHGLIRASSLIVKRSSRQRRTVLLCQRHGKVPQFICIP